MNADDWLSLLPLLIVLLIGAAIWIKVRRDARSSPPVPIQGGAPLPEYKGPLAFFRKHYNGDYSLGRSYWLNTFLVSLFAPVLGLLLLPWLSENFSARYSSAGFLFITSLGVVAWFWAVAGTWASASKHVSRGGKSGWAAAAKFMIVMGVLKTFGDVGNLAPALQEHMRVALGAQLGPSTKLEVRADGRSILLSGGINDGTADQLEKALQMTPAVSTVVLSSTGGWIREGQMLAEVIRKRQLNTYVEGHCASACTIALLAGKDRAAAPGAKIGFHASRSVGSQADTPTPEETAQLLAVYRSAGIPDAFVRQVVATPHAQMWYPTHEEMLSAGVLTRQSLGGETAAVATAIRSKESLSAELKKIDVFAALAERSPTDFDRVAEAAWQKVQQGATDAEVTTAARGQLTATMPRFLRLASDDTLVAYQALMQEQLEALRKKDVNACVEMAFPSGQHMSVVGNLPPVLIQREMNLMAQLFREADPKRALKPSQQAVERVVTQAAGRMTQEQLEAFSDTEARRRDPKAACASAIAFFGGLNSIPLAERGRALRVLYSSN
jgi:hypothetical protein